MANTPDFKDRLLNQIPHIFYPLKDKIVIDKCRSWTLPANLDLIDKYITKKPKIIVMTRPLIDIVKSFVFIRKMNAWPNPEIGLLNEGSEPIMRSLEGVRHAKKINKGQFLFISYDDLLDQPNQTIKNIYKFCGLESFEHDFMNIKNNTQEKDDLLNLIGLHDIRSILSRRNLDISLSKETLLKIKEIEDYEYSESY